ncbi:hypothetical protein FSC37_22610 [Piscinibacter aquaticus]|uniref:Uncharacterized protein n=1 Tax=Piscinibacter aquaticus TaxID=392597 RepID=A0A5C6TPE9_9BURK|nr:hypothetical protein FSC37_22610 [Piscinibacter aquaticus]
MTDRTKHRKPARSAAAGRRLGTQRLAFVRSWAEGLDRSTPGTATSMSTAPATAGGPAAN